MGEFVLQKWLEMGQISEGIEESKKLNGFRN